MCSLWMLGGAALCGAILMAAGICVTVCIDGALDRFGKVLGIK